MQRWCMSGAVSAISTRLRAILRHFRPAGSSATRLSLGLAAALLVASCSNEGQSPGPGPAASSPAASVAAASPASSSAPGGSAPLSVPAPKADLQARANELAQRLILLDGHVDLPDRL